MPRSTPSRDLLPSYAGLSMMAEIAALERALENPERPVMGDRRRRQGLDQDRGPDPSRARMDVLVVGGRHGHHLPLAQGHEDRRLLSEPDFVPTAKDIMARAERSGCEIVLPPDVVVANELKEGAGLSGLPRGEVPDGAHDPRFRAESVAALKHRFEDVTHRAVERTARRLRVGPFGEGTFALAREVARLTEEGKLVSVAGGGDTVRALNVAGAARDFTYVSTAGGAFLEWLGGHELPAVRALARSGARH